MARVARRLAIALASFVVAWFAVSFVAAWFLGSSAYGSPVILAIVVVVGAGVYLDILRRDRRSR